MRNVMAALAALLVALPASATVTGNPPPAVYTCTGAVTVYTIPFAYLAPGDLLITRTTGATVATLVLTADYSVKPSIAPTTGTLTLAVACPNNSTLTITRNMALTQPQSFRTGNYQGPPHEQAFDRLEMQMQQVNANAQRVANSGQNGQLTAIDWTRFNNSVLSSTNQYQSGGTGSVVQTIAAKLGETVSVHDFGAKGDSTTDDTAAIQAAINYISNTSSAGVQGRVILNRGGYKITAPLVFSTNIQFIGEGGGFGSVIRPAATFSGAAAIVINGALVTGGFAFRQNHKNYTVDCTNVTKAILPLTFQLSNAYSITFDHVWIFNGVGTGWDVIGSNDISFYSPRAYGLTADPAVSAFGIRFRDTSDATVVDPDIEVYNVGLSQELASRVTVASGHFERNIIGWNAIGGATGSLTVVGGSQASPGVSGNAAVIAGPNVTVLGGTYSAASGGGGLIVNNTSRFENVRIYNAGPDVTDSKNYSLRDMAGTTNWYPAKARSNHTPTSGAATTYYNVTVPFLAANYGIVEMTVNARDSAGFTLATGKYRVAVSNPGGTLNVSPVAPYATSTVAASGNYGMTIAVATSVAGTVLSLQITATTTGALGAGIAPLVSTEAELVQWSSTGSVFLQAL